MIELFAVIFTLFLICALVFVLLNFLGVDLYPSPKFTCSECEHVEKIHGVCWCKACRDEIDDCPLSCVLARRTRGCYKSARKASNEQQQEKA